MALTRLHWCAGRYISLIIVYTCNKNWKTGGSSWIWTALHETLLYACTFTQSAQHQCYSLLGNYNIKSMYRKDLIHSLSTADWFLLPLARRWKPRRYWLSRDKKKGLIWIILYEKLVPLKSFKIDTLNYCVICPKYMFIQGCVNNVKMEW